MQSSTLSTLRRVLSTVDAYNHIHHMELRVYPRCGGITQVDWAAWERVYSILAGPQFQLLQVLYLSMGDDYVAGVGIYFPYLEVETSGVMVAAHPILAKRGVEVSHCWKSGYRCSFCSFYRCD